MDLISIVVPCYNEERALPLFADALFSVTDDMKADAEFEFIFVDDGSADATTGVLRDMSERDARFKFISFSRNFGKEAAMFAGFEHATGDYVTVMDADLQTPPELLKDMYSLIRTREFDCIAAKRTSRGGEPLARRFFSRRFYKLMNSISNVNVAEGAMDFRLMTKQMADAILALKESSRFLKGIYGWVGFRTKWIECDVMRRAAGESKWPFLKLLAYSLDGITAFSSVPLFLSAALGALFCLLALALLIAVIIQAALGAPLSLLCTLCAVFFAGGVQLLCTGILGLYLSKTHLETKKRPIYLIRETNIR